MVSKLPANARTVSEDLHLRIVNNAKLLFVLLNFFKRANWISPAVQRYGTDENDSYVDVSYRGDGTIEWLKSPLHEDTLKTLSDYVGEVLVASQRVVVGQALCCSRHLEVRGLYRYGDVFQILPIPPEAAHAPVVAADHPFVLQFRYRRSTDGAINSRRRQEKTAMLTRSLNVICRPTLVPYSRYTRFFWSAFVSGELAPRWLQEGYGYSGFVPEIDDFSEMLDLPRIKLYPSAEYYSDTFMSDNYELALPDLADRYFDKVFGLDAEEFRRFAIASTWFSQSSALWAESSSSAFVAIVSAVEALLDKGGEVCKECNQPRHRVTMRFKAFLEQHVPNVRERFPKELDQIYGVRSDLAHGGRLLLADLEYWNFFGAWLQQQQETIQRNAHDIVATALRNWILGH